MRFLALDFETNGLPCDKLRPCGAFPTQVSVDAFVPSTGEIVHLYDSFIRGALDVSPWVLQYTPVTLELLDRAPHPDDVATALAQLWQEGDIIVAHNAQFDLDTVLPKIAAPTHPFLTGPSVCSKQEPWVRMSVGKQPSLADLCATLDVPFCGSDAHDATYDTKILACCLKAAHERNRTWSLRTPKSQITLHACLGMPPSPQVDRRVKIPKEPLNPGDELFVMGKHKGYCFRDVRDADDGYTYYAETITKPFGQMARFKKWLQDSQCPTCKKHFCHCKSLPLDTSMYNDVLTFERCKGMTYQEAAIQNRGYCIGFHMNLNKAKSSKPQRRFHEWIGATLCNRCYQFKDSKQCCIFD